MSNHTRIKEGMQSLGFGFIIFLIITTYAQEGPPAYACKLEEADCSPTNSTAKFLDCSICTTTTLYDLLKCCLVVAKPCKNPVLNVRNENGNLSKSLTYDREVDKFCAEFQDKYGYSSAHLEVECRADDDGRNATIVVHSEERKFRDVEDEIDCTLGKYVTSSIKYKNATLALVEVEVTRCYHEMCLQLLNDNRQVLKSFVVTCDNHGTQDHNKCAETVPVKLPLTGLAPFTPYTFVSRQRWQGWRRWSEPAAKLHFETLEDVPLDGPTIPPGGFAFANCGPKDDDDSKTRTIGLSVFWKAQERRSARGHITRYSIDVSVETADAKTFYKNETNSTRSDIQIVMPLESRLKETLKMKAHICSYNNAGRSIKCSLLDLDIDDALERSKLFHLQQLDGDWNSVRVDKLPLDTEQIAVYYESYAGFVDSWHSVASNVTEIVDLNNKDGLRLLGISADSPSKGKSTGILTPHCVEVANRLRGGFHSMPTSVIVILVTVTIFALLIIATLVWSLKMPNNYLSRFLLRRGKRKHNRHPITPTDWRALPFAEGEIYADPATRPLQERAPRVGHQSSSSSAGMRASPTSTSAGQQTTSSSSLVGGQTSPNTKVDIYNLLDTSNDE